jgi:hypothetical protein
LLTLEIFYISDDVEGALQEIAGGGGGGAEIGYSDNDISNPPTDEDIDGAFWITFCCWCRLCRSD